MQLDFTERDKIFYSISMQEQKEDISFFHHYIELVSNLVVTITEKLVSEKVQLKRYEDYYEVHYFKFVLQTLSLNHLFNGTPLKSIKPGLNLFDLSTIYNATRSLMESFLAINYLYYNHKSEEQATFRYLLYIASGLNSRQSYPASTKENLEKQAFEKNEIQKALDEITGNAYFKGLPEYKQKDLLKRLHAFEMGMKEVITEAGLDNDIFHTMWRLLSNYSHSEYLEAMQLREYLGDPSRHTKTIYNAYRICFMLNANMVIKMTERFDVAKKIFDEQNLEIKTIIEFYNGLLFGIKANKVEEMPKK